ncbi:MAG: PhzF family phenazine biosynthesis protein [Tissierellaceae bacterium]
MEIMIYQVDAFSDRAFGGNPAAVVLSPRSLTSDMMQDIAKEMNLSETAFVIQFAKDSFWVRFFTPVCEVDLCGHATIATFYTLGKMGYIEGMVDGIKTVYQETRSGKLAVELEYRDGEIYKVFMEQARPKIIGGIGDLERLARVMGIRVEDIGIGRETIYPKIVSTGLPDIMLPIKDKEILDKMNVNMGELSKMSEELNIIGVHAFYLADRKSEIVYTRNFAPLVGINEEAATGTSNGALIYFLRQNNLIDKNRLISYQGQSMNRPSTIHCKLIEREGTTLVKVGGDAKIVLSGIMSI